MTLQQTESRSAIRLVHEWYRPLREQIRARESPGTMREHTEGGAECQFDERFLQILWNEQRLADLPRTTSGEALTVVSPGTWNVGAGPDFRQAVIRLGANTLHGDVEVHRTTADWFRHGHDTDPAYGNVVLHVVWRDTETAHPSGLPCLDLSRHVDLPLRELMDELSTAVYPYARQVAPGSCAVRWALTDDDTVRSILRTAGLSRFEDKAVRLGRRTVADGPDQVLYEGVFEALGYKVNQHAFRRLAEGVPLTLVRKMPNAEAREALLFGSAALLPDPSTTTVLPHWHGRLSRLWDSWWSLGRTAADITWQRHGGRPVNSPERRLAAGLEWLCRCDMAPQDWLLRTATTAGEPKALLRGLRSSLLISTVWDSARTWKNAMPKPARLLGAARVDDIIVNVLLPFLNSVGRRHVDDGLSALARETFMRVRPLQSNRRLVEASHRFLVPPSRLRSLVRCACSQQGMLELYRCFCTALHGDCTNCPFTTPEPFEDFPCMQ